MKSKPLWLAISAGAFWLLLFIGTHLPKKPGGKEYGLDKVAHFSAFAILATLLGCAAIVWQGKLRWFHAVMIVVAISAYGVFDEVTQMAFTSTRKADFFDWVADTSGAVVGVLIAYSLSGRLTNGGKNIGSADRS